MAHLQHSRSTRCPCAPVRRPRLAPSLSAGFPGRASAMADSHVFFELHGSLRVLVYTLVLAHVGVLVRRHWPLVARGLPNKPSVRPWRRGRCSGACQSARSRGHMRRRRRSRSRKTSSRPSNAVRRCRPFHGMPCTALRGLRFWLRVCPKYIKETCHPSAKAQGVPRSRETHDRVVMRRAPVRPTTEDRVSLSVTAYRV